MSSTQAHTPGDWTVTPSASPAKRMDRELYVRGPDGSAIAKVYVYGSPEHVAAGEANAKLMGAALNMSETLCTIGHLPCARGVDMPCKDRPSLAVREYCTGCMARAAIDAMEEGAAT